MRTINRHITAFMLGLLLVSAACQPVQPPGPEGTIPPSTPETGTIPPALPSDSATIAGDWAGTLEVAGMNLSILVTFMASNGGITGMIDIPEQGASDLPLNNITIDLPDVHFEMLDGPQLAVFNGQLTDDGMLKGTFTQSGVEGVFTLLREVAPAESADQPGPSIAASTIYTDPQELFTVPVPTNWTVSETDGFVTLAAPDDQIKVYVLALRNEDLEVAIDEAWQIVDPSLDLITDTVESPPPPAGVESIVSISYEDPADLEHVVLAQAELHEGVAYILLLDAQLAALQQRNSQVQIIGSGLNILALAEQDLSGVAPLPIDDTLLAELTSYIEETLARYKIPGAAVAIVEQGEVVYAQGFGVRDPATGSPVTTETLMRMGSTGKSLTTMLMATLVDDGLMTWDTPAREILPEFAVKDPELTNRITVRNLVCACTGVPRRDLELIFNANQMRAEDVVASLRTFDFFTDFGEAFQYSNQMVATGGYVAGAAAAGAVPADLMAAYTQALEERVLDPMGLISTTLSFTEVTANDNYAIPHAATFDLSYHPFPLEIETLLNPVAPAGAHWTTVQDMARYLITELNEGIAPNGTRVVSAENLRLTWEPQIAVAADTSYGLGWFVSEYKGQPLIYHGGNTFGYTSDFAFLPDAEIGIAVLTNAQGSNFFNEGIRLRLFELVFALEPEAEAQIAFAYEQLVEMNQAVSDRLLPAVDPAAVQPYLGRYHNDALGDIELTLEETVFHLDAGEFRSRLLPLRSEDKETIEAYLFQDPPLTGLQVQLAQDDQGSPTVVLGEGVTQYTFLPAE